MFSVVVNNEAEFDRALAAAEARGLRIACVSNAGLNAPRRRLTFLPEDCFLKPGEEPKPAQQPMDVRELLKDLPPLSGCVKSK